MGFFCMQQIVVYKMQCSMKSSILSGPRPHSDQGCSHSWRFQLNNWNGARVIIMEARPATNGKMLSNVSDLHCLHGFFSGQWLLRPLCKCLHGNTAVLNRETDLQIRNGRNGLYFRLCEALGNFTVFFTLKNFLFFQRELPLNLSN